MHLPAGGGACFFCLEFCRLSFIQGKICLGKLLLLLLFLVPVTSSGSGPLLALDGQLWVVADFGAGEVEFGDLGCCACSGASGK